MTSHPGKPNTASSHGLAHRAIALAALAAVLALPIYLSGCDDKPAQNTESRPQAKVINVTVSPVLRKSTPRHMEVVGTLYGRQESTLSAKVSGQIIRQLADVGDRVDAGQVLSQIDRTDYELAVAQAQAAVQEPLSQLGLKQLPAGEIDFSTVATVRRAKVQADNARARRDRAKQLFDQKPPLMSEQDFADVQTAYEVAIQDHDVALLQAQALLTLARTRQRQLDVAMQRLADTDVKAPAVLIDSTLIPTLPAPTSQPAPSSQSLRPFAVAQRLISQGEYVREGTPMYRVVADQVLVFRGAAPEWMIGSIATGQTAALSVAGSEHGFTGIVTRISPAVDISSRTFAMEITFDNRALALLPGSFGRVQIIVGQEKDVLFVPQEAVLSFAGVDKFFAVADGKAVEYRIRTGEKEGKWVAVRGESPMPAVTQVITSNLTKLSNGVPVTIDTVAAPATPTTRPEPR